MTIKRSISITAAIATLAVTGVAGAAEQPVVSEQHSIAGAALVTIPGTGIQKGEWMGSKAVLVSRDVRLEPGQKARVTLRATGKRRIAGVALSEARFVGAKVLDTGYVGKRQVTVEVALGRRAAAGETAVTVYALTR